MAYAPVDEPQVALAVIVENAGSVRFGLGRAHRAPRVRLPAARPGAQRGGSGRPCAPVRPRRRSAGRARAPTGNCPASWRRRPPPLPREARHHDGHRPCALAGASAPALPGPGRPAAASLPVADGLGPAGHVLGGLRPRHALRRPGAQLRARRRRDVAGGAVPGGPLAAPGAAALRARRGAAGGGAAVRHHAQGRDALAQTSASPSSSPASC
jgi:hypothetical protein